MKRWKGWNGTGHIIVTVCCLVIISGTCFIIAVEESESESPSPNDPYNQDYLSKLRRSLKNVAKSFKSDPLTSLEPLLEPLNQQEAVLNNMRTELSDILRLTGDQPNGNIAKRSLKSTDELPSCPSFSPLLQRVLRVNQVNCQQSK